MGDSPVRLRLVEVSGPRPASQTATASAWARGCGLHRNPSAPSPRATPWAKRLRQGTTIVNGIRVNRDKQIRMVIACELGAITMVNVYVAIADENRAHARFGTDATCQLLCYGQGDILLPGPITANRTRFVATVAWIDRNYDIASRTIFFRRALHRRETAGALQVNNETVPEL